MGPYQSTRSDIRLFLALLHCWKLTWGCRKHLATNEIIECFTIVWYDINRSGPKMFKIQILIAKEKYTVSVCSNSTFTVSNRKVSIRIEVPLHTHSTDKTVLWFQMKTWETRGRGYEVFFKIVCELVPGAWIRNIFWLSERFSTHVELL